MTAIRYLSFAAWLDIPTPWLLLGITLGAATIALVSLLQTRWRQAKPWKKCALLSLWVHILFAYMATVVQIASNGLGFGPGRGPGYGAGPPIQVAILSEAEIIPLSPVTIAEESEEISTADDSTAVDDSEESREKSRENVVEPATGSEAPAEPLDAPGLLALPEPEAKAESSAAAVSGPTPETAQPEDTSSEAAIVENPSSNGAAIAIEAQRGRKSLSTGDVTTRTEPPVDKDSRPLSAARLLSAATPNEPLPQTNEASAVKSTPTGSTKPHVEATASVPSSYASRFAANRDQLVAGGGGNATTERSVRAAITWLAQAQSQDGRWDARRHGAGQERYVLGQDRNGAGAKADTGVTGLALLAMLGAGETHRDGSHTVEVARGLDFLRRSQRPDGNLCGEAELFAQMYCHSMAAFAASEAYAITKDERLAPMVRAAAGYSLAVQHPTDGGWRYRPGDTGDTSQLGWQVMALRSADLGGVDVPQVTWTRVDRFLRQVERGGAGGLAAYRPEGPPTRPMTAESLYCRQLLTGQPDGQLSPAALNEAIASLSKEPPSAAAVNLYYWYYATLALHRAQHVSPEAANAWQRWNEALTRTLLSTQSEDGSWPTTCLWGGYGGRVFTTSLAAMCLEVYYRYADGENGIEQAVDPNLARRGEASSVLPAR
jgi:hypothetical protein